MATSRSDSLKEIVVPLRKNERKVKLYMHPPSIPTRFQTVHFDDNEYKAFNSSSRRFEVKLNDLPGPGYYSNAADRLENAFKNVSISKKGFGGFASKGRRFKNSFGVSKDIYNVSPATYKPTTPIYSSSLSSSVSPAFRSSMVPSTALPAPVVRTKTGIKPTPGPGEYAPERYQNAAVKVVQSAFKSKTARTLGGIKPMKTIQEAPESPESTSPLPPKQVVPSSSFKASSRSHHDKPKIGPSIGQYDLVEKKIPRAPTRPQVKFGMIAKEPPKPSTPGSTQVSIPGSGMTPIAFPSPGDYEIAYGTDTLHRSRPAPSMSKATRFRGLRNYTTVGPGSYQPYIDGGHRSFHLNLKNTWA